MKNTIQLLVLFAIIAALNGSGAASGYFVGLAVIVWLLAVLKWLLW